jgi:hypothetical protein
MGGMTLWRAVSFIHCEGEGVYKKTEGGERVPSAHVSVASTQRALVDYRYYMLKEGGAVAYSGASGSPVLSRAEDGVWQVVRQINSSTHHWQCGKLEKNDTDACAHDQSMGITSKQIQHFLRLPQLVAQAAFGFELTGAPAGHWTHHFMAAKVNGRHNYEGTAAAAAGDGRKL